MLRNEVLTVEFLRECFDSRDGVLYWRERPVAHFQRPADHITFAKKHAGKPAGKLGVNGYVTVGLRIDGRAISMAAHRIVWALHHGCWPEKHLDHINRVRHDNRIENLREVTVAENNRNCATRRIFPNVAPGNAGRFDAQVKLGDVGVHIGVFDSAEEAHEHRMFVIDELKKLAHQLAKKTPNGWKLRKQVEPKC